MLKTVTQYGIFTLLGGAIILLLSFVIEKGINQIDEMLIPCQHGTNFLQGKCRCDGSPFNGTYCSNCMCEYGSCSLEPTIPFRENDYGCRCPTQTKRFGYLCDLCNTVDANESCKGECKPDFFGPKCERICYANLDFTNGNSVCNLMRSNGGHCSTCHGHGTCEDGFCKCDKNYFNDGIKECVKTCPPSTNGKSCSGHGDCKLFGNTPACVCENGWNGITCDIPCPGIEEAGLSCFGHGICNVDFDAEKATCDCNQKFRGLDCSIECPGDIVVCNGHGTCDEVGICTCQTNVQWSLPSCKCSDELTCNGRGSCVSGEICACFGNFAGDHCLQCKTNWHGENCDLFCDPYLKANISDKNENQWGCFGHGTCIERAGKMKCTCNLDTTITLNLGGAINDYVSYYDSEMNCGECLFEYFPKQKIVEDHGMPSDYTVPCEGSCNPATCNNRGICNHNYGIPGENLCTCDILHLSDETFCTSCEENWYPLDFGRDIFCNKFCIASGELPAECDGTIDCVQCNGHGTCSDDAECLCTDGYSGDRCQIYCASENGLVCGGHGTCESNAIQQLMEHEFEKEGGIQTYSCTCDPQDPINADSRIDWDEKLAQGLVIGTLDPPPDPEFFGETCDYSCVKPPWEGAADCNGLGNCSVVTIRDPLDLHIPCFRDIDCMDSTLIAQIISGDATWDNLKGPFCHKTDDILGCEKSTDDCYEILLRHRPKQMRSEDCVTSDNFVKVIDRPVSLPPLEEITNGQNNNEITEEECGNYAYNAGLYFSSETSASHPTGCWLYNTPNPNQIYYNYASTGQDCSSSEPCLQKRKHVIVTTSIPDLSMSQVECQNYATGMSWMGPTNQFYRPTGCIQFNENEIWYNLNTSSTTECGTSDWSCVQKYDDTGFVNRRECEIYADANWVVDSFTNATKPYGCFLNTNGKYYYNTAFDVIECSSTYPCIQKVSCFAALESLDWHSYCTDVHEHIQPDVFSACDSVSSFCNPLKYAPGDVYHEYFGTPDLSLSRHECLDYATSVGSIHVEFDTSNVNYPRGCIIETNNNKIVYNNGTGNCSYTNINCIQKRDICMSMVDMTDGIDVSYKLNLSYEYHKRNYPFKISKEYRIPVGALEHDEAEAFFSEFPFDLDMKLPDDFCPKYNLRYPVFNEVRENKQYLCNGLIVDTKTCDGILEESANNFYNPFTVECLNSAESFSTYQDAILNRGDGCKIVETQKDHVFVDNMEEMGRIYIDSVCNHITNKFPICKYPSPCDFNPCLAGYTCVNSGTKAICSTTGNLNSTCLKGTMERLSYTTYSCDIDIPDTTCPRNNTFGTNVAQHCIDHNPIVSLIDNIGENENKTLVGAKYINFEFKADNLVSTSTRLEFLSGTTNVVTIYIRQGQIQLNEVELLQACPITDQQCNDVWAYEPNIWYHIELEIRETSVKMTRRDTGVSIERSILSQNEITHVQTVSGNGIATYRYIVSETDVPSPYSCTYETCDLDVSYRHICSDIIRNVEYPSLLEGDNILNVCSTLYSNTRLPTNESFIVTQEVYDLNWEKYCDFYNVFESDDIQPILLSQFTKNATYGSNENSILESTCEAHAQKNNIPFKYDDLGTAVVCGCFIANNTIYFNTNTICLQNCTTNNICIQQQTYEDLERYPECIGFVDPLDGSKKCIEDALKYDWTTSCSLLEIAKVPETLKNACPKTCYNHLLTVEDDFCSERSELFTSNIEVIDTCDIDWYNYCLQDAKGTLEGKCSAVECTCDYESYEGISGQACELHCPLAFDGSACAEASNLGKCVYTPAQKTFIENGGIFDPVWAIEGECQCFEGEGTRNCDIQCLGCNNGTYANNYITTDSGQPEYDIATEKCNEYADDVNFNFAQISASDRPAGCFLDIVNNNIYFNSDTSLITCSSNYQCVIKNPSAGQIGICDNARGVCDCLPPFTQIDTYTTRDWRGKNISVVERSYRDGGATGKDLYRIRQMQGKESFVKNMLQKINIDNDITFTAITNNYVYNGQNDTDINLCRGAQYNINVPNGHDMRIVPEDNCQNKGCNDGEWLELPLGEADLHLDSVHTFLSDGIYFYVCKNHPKMVGKFIVSTCSGTLAYDGTNDWNGIYNEFLNYPERFWCNDKTCGTGDIAMLGNLAGTSSRYNFDCNKQCLGFNSTTQLSCNGNGYCGVTGECICDRATVLKDVPDPPIRKYQVIPGIEITDTKYEASSLERTGFRGESCDIICPGYDPLIGDMNSICNGHGVCDLAGICACELGYTGDECQFSCPVDEGNICNGHGTCEMAEIRVQLDIFDGFSSSCSHFADYDNCFAYGILHDLEVVNIAHTKLVGENTACKRISEVECEAWGNFQELTYRYQGTETSAGNPHGCYVTLENKVFFNTAGQVDNCGSNDILCICQTAIPDTVYCSLFINKLVIHTKGGNAYTKKKGLYDMDSTGFGGNFIETTSGSYMGGVSEQECKIYAIGNGHTYIDDQTSLSSGHVNCAWWAAFGECSNNPGYMWVNCKQECSKRGSPKGCVKRNSEVWYNTFESSPSCGYSGVNCIQKAPYTYSDAIVQCEIENCLAIQQTPPASDNYYVLTESKFVTDSFNDGFTHAESCENPILINQIPNVVGEEISLSLCLGFCRLFDEETIVKVVNEFDLMDLNERSVNEVECKAYAEDNNIAYYGVVDVSNEPKGCYLDHYYNRIYFNTVSTSPVVCSENYHCIQNHVVESSCTTFSLRYGPMVSSCFKCNTALDNTMTPIRRYKKRIEGNTMFSIKTSGVVDRSVTELQCQQFAVDQGKTMLSVSYDNIGYGCTTGYDNYYWNSYDNEVQCGVGGHNCIELSGQSLMTEEECDDYASGFYGEYEKGTYEDLPKGCLIINTIIKYNRRTEGRNTAYSSEMKGVVNLPNVVSSFKIVTTGTPNLSISEQKCRKLAAIDGRWLETLPLVAVEVTDGQINDMSMSVTECETWANDNGKWWFPPVDWSTNVRGCVQTTTQYNTYVRYNTNVGSTHTCRDGYSTCIQKASEEIFPKGCFRLETNDQIYYAQNGKGDCTTTYNCLELGSFDTFDGNQPNDQSVDERQCEHYAETFAHSFSYNILDDVPDIPRGCIMHKTDGDISFHRGSGTNCDSSQSYICIIIPQFTKQEFGVVNVGLNINSIGVSECKSFGLRNGFTIFLQVSATSFPTGCFVTEGRNIYFNTDVSSTKKCDLTCSCIQYVEFTAYNVDELITGEDYTRYIRNPQSLCIKESALDVETRAQTPVIKSLREYNDMCKYFNTGDNCPIKATENQCNRYSNGDLFSRFRLINTNTGYNIPSTYDQIFSGPPDLSMSKEDCENYATEFGYTWRGNSDDGNVKGCFTQHHVRSVWYNERDTTTNCQDVSASTCIQKRKYYIKRTGQADMSISGLECDVYASIKAMNFEPVLKIDRPAGCFLESNVVYYNTFEGLIDCGTDYQCVEKYTTDISSQFVSMSECAELSDFYGTINSEHPHGCVYQTDAGVSQYKYLYNQNQFSTSNCDSGGKFCVKKIAYSNELRGDRPDGCYLENGKYKYNEGIIEVYSGQPNLSLTSEECEALDGTDNYVWQQTLSQLVNPSGCFFQHSGGVKKIYYNTDISSSESCGNQHSSICIQKGSPIAIQVSSGPPSLSLSQAECQAFTTTIGYSYYNLDHVNYPMGCFSVPSQSEVYYNDATQGVDCSSSEKCIEKPCTAFRCVCASDMYMDETTSVCKPISSRPIIKASFTQDRNMNEEKTFEIDCQVISESQIECAQCSCFGDFMYGYWAGQTCSTCGVGYGKTQCSTLCPDFDGENKNSICAGFGQCLFGSEKPGLERVFQESTCLCGQEEQYQPKTENVLPSAIYSEAYEQYSWYEPITNGNTYSSLDNAKVICSRYNDISIANLNGYCWGVFKRSNTDASPFELHMGNTGSEFITYGLYYRKQLIPKQSVTYTIEERDLITKIDSSTPLICKNDIEIVETGLDVCNHFNTKSKTCDICEEGWTGKNCRSKCQKCLLRGSCKEEPDTISAAKCDCPSETTGLWEYQCCPAGFRVKDLVTWQSLPQSQIDQIKVQKLYDPYTTNDMDSAYHCKKCPGVFEDDWMEPVAAYKVCSGLSRGKCIINKVNQNLECECKLNPRTGTTWKGRACSCDDSIETPYSQIAAAADSTDYGCIIPTNGTAVCPDPNPSETNILTWKPFMIYAIGQSIDGNYIGNEGSFNKYLGPLVRISSPLTWSGGIASEIAVTIGAHGKCDDITPCHTGEGPCRADTDCAGGLLCNFRVGNTMNIPGYDPTRVEGGFKYCYDPQENLVGCDPVPTFRTFENNIYYYNYKYWNGRAFVGASENHYVPMTKDANNNLVIHKRDFPCPLGKYGVVWDNNPECALCPSGFYQDETAQSTCKSGCGGGQLGVIDFDECVLCPQGKAPSSDFQSCVDCPSGKYEQNRVCLSCPKNTYQDHGVTGQSGNSACKACPAGRSTENQIEFVSMSNLFYDSIDKIRYMCLGCAAGRYNANEESDCIECPLGTYSTGRNEYYEVKQGTPDISTENSDCYGPDISFGVWQSYINENLNPAGCFYQNSGGVKKLYYNNNISSTAPCGNIHNSICVQKQVENKATVQCSDCPIGSYNDQLGQESCFACPSGEYQDQTKQTSCKRCVLGKYSGKSQSLCTNCAPGQYQDNVGQSECKDCPIGSYENEASSTECKDCPRDYTHRGSPGGPIYANGVKLTPTSDKFSPPTYVDGDYDLCGYCPNTGMTEPMIPFPDHFREIENKFTLQTFGGNFYGGTYSSDDSCANYCRIYSGNRGWHPTGFAYSDTNADGASSSTNPCYCFEKGGLYSIAECKYDSRYAQKYDIYSHLICPRTSWRQRAFFDDTDHVKC